jgi:hypothetical protein
MELGRPAVESTSAVADRSALPFNVNADPGGGILLHVKVLSPDPVVRLQTADAVQRALKGIEVNGQKIALMVTADNIEMETAQVKQLAAIIMPQVLNTLGIKNIT